jgi:hypothetical protein
MIFPKLGYHDGYQHDKQGLLIIPSSKPQAKDIRRRPWHEDAAREKINNERFPLNIAPIEQNRKIKETER